MHGRTVGQYPAQDAVNVAAHRLARDLADNVPGLDHRADVLYLMKYAVGRRPQDALARKAADQPRNVRVRNGTAVCDDPAEIVAAHRFHRRVAVHPGGEARPHADDAGRIRDARAKVALGQDRIHDGVRVQPCNALRLRVGQHRDVPALQNCRNVPHGRGALGGDVLDLHGAEQQRL